MQERSQADTSPSSEAVAPSLGPASRRALWIQKTIARLLSPLTLIAVWVVVRFGMGVRLADARAVRREYHRLAKDRAPLLLCANHLTMFDSALIAWALGSPLWYFLNFRTLAWNVPEERNFASTWPRRVLTYVYKCVPVRRGGDRAGVAESLARFTYLLAQGEVGLVFPEGGRSRSGRVEIERAAYGVGRIVKSLPGCRVVCIYLRGEAQTGHTTLPVRGDRLHTYLAQVEPKSDYPGLRGSRDIARQITAKLLEMEEEHFARVGTPEVPA